MLTSYVLSILICGSMTHFFRHYLLVLAISPRTIRSLKLYSAKTAYYRARNGQKSTSSNHMLYDISGESASNTSMQTKDARKLQDPEKIDAVEDNVLDAAEAVTTEGDYTSNTFSNDFSGDSIEGVQWKKSRKTSIRPKTSRGRLQNAETDGS